MTANPLAIAIEGLAGSRAVVSLPVSERIIGSPLSRITRLNWKLLMVVVMFLVGLSPPNVFARFVMAKSATGTTVLAVISLPIVTACDFDVVSRTLANLLREVSSVSMLEQEVDPYVPLYNSSTYLDHSTLC